MIKLLGGSGKQREYKQQAKLTASTPDEELFAKTIKEKLKKIPAQDFEKIAKDDIQSTKDLLKLSKKDITMQNSNEYHDLTNQLELYDEALSASKVTLGELTAKLEAIHENSVKERVKRLGNSAEERLKDTAYIAGQGYGLFKGIFGLFGEGFAKILNKYPYKDIKDGDSKAVRVGKQLFNKARKIGIMVGNFFGLDMQDETEPEDVNNPSESEDIILKGNYSINNLIDTNIISPDFDTESANIKDHIEQTIELAREYEKYKKTIPNSVDIGKGLSTLPLNDLDVWYDDVMDWIYKGYVIKNSDGSLSFSEDFKNLILYNIRLGKGDLLKSVLSNKFTKFFFEKKLFDRFYKRARLFKQKVKGYNDLKKYFDGILGTNQSRETDDQKIIAEIKDEQNMSTKIDLIEKASKNNKKSPEFIEALLKNLISMDNQLIRQTDRDQKMRFAQLQNLYGKDVNLNESDSIKLDSHIELGPEIFQEAARMSTARVAVKPINKEIEATTTTQMFDPIPETIEIPKNKSISTIDVIPDISNAKFNIDTNNERTEINQTIENITPTIDMDLISSKEVIGGFVN